MDIPAGWYPDPSLESAEAGLLRFWDGLAWTDLQVHPDTAAKQIEARRIEPWALVISLMPLIGILGGAIAMAKGKTMTGALMIAIGFSTLVVMSVLSSR